MQRDYSRLLKPNWFSSDIEAFYGVSKPYADFIKATVERDSGVIAIDVDKERRSVSADDVIKAMGGTSRLEEMQIYSLYLSRVGEDENEQINKS